MKTVVRYIDTAGLPVGFDVGDLITQGTTGPALIEWCKARVRPGYPPEEPRPAPVPRAEKTPAPISGGAGAEVASGGRPFAEPNATPALPPVQVETEGNLATIVRKLPQAPPEEEEMMLPPEYSDDSLAREFTRQFADRFAYVSEWGKWMFWDGARWANDNSMQVFHSIRMVLREVANEILTRQAEFQAKTRGMAGQVSSARTVSNVERMCRSDPKHAVLSSQFDTDEWAINTPGGFVNLTDGTIRPPSLRDYCTKVTRVTPGGDCPTWERFLRDVTNNNEELMLYLQRVAGYSLTGSTREHAIFFFYGTGRNGKGTFINTLEWIVGDYSKVASMDTFTESKNDRHSTELATLMGARLVTSQEVDEGKRWAEARIKSMSGGDPITARFMRNDDFTYTPQFKLMISGNHRPALRNVDEAMQARLHMVPFTITVPVERRDPQLADKLRAEAAGILKWAIEGCSEWRRIRLAPPLVVRKATEEYFAAQDTVGMWIRDECELHPENAGKTAELYSSYSKYCADAGEFAVQRRRWLDAMELKGVFPGKVRGERRLRGIRLNNLQ